MALTVSVIMAMRDAATTVRESIQSIAIQSYPPEEVIIIDDGSLDDSRAVAQAALVEFGIAGRVMRTSASVGAGAARNRAAACSKGDMLAILDADDCWTADHLAHASRSFDQSPDLAAYCARVEIRDDRTWDLPGRVFPQNPGYQPEGPRCAYDGVLAGLNLWHVTFCIRRKWFMEAGGYHEALKCYEDQWLFMNAGRLGKFHLSNDIGCIVRSRSGSLSTTSEPSGKLTMRKAMYTQRIALTRHVRRDPRFSEKDRKSVDHAAIMLVTETFRDACRARRWRTAIRIISATVQGVATRPWLAIRAISVAFTKTGLSGFTLGARKVWAKVKSIVGKSGSKVASNSSQQDGVK